jgi:hypothetical protein
VWRAARQASRTAQHSGSRAALQPEGVPRAGARHRWGESVAQQAAVPAAQRERAAAQRERAARRQAELEAVAAVPVAPQWARAPSGLLEEVVSAAEPKPD